MCVLYYVTDVVEMCAVPSTLIMLLSDHSSTLTHILLHQLTSNHTDETRVRGIVWRYLQWKSNCSYIVLSHCSLTLFSHTVLTLFSPIGSLTALTLFSHCSLTVLNLIPLFSHCSLKVLTLLSHCSRTGITVLSHCFHTVLIVLSVTRKVGIQSIR